METSQEKAPVPELGHEMEMSPQHGHTLPGMKPKQKHFSTQNTMNKTIRT